MPNFKDNISVFQIYALTKFKIYVYLIVFYILGWYILEVSYLFSILIYFLFIYLGGAGGKGTWGKLGDEIDLPWVDPNDPNYDSDTQE